MTYLKCKRGLIYIRLMCNIYWEQTACLIYADDTESEAKLKELLDKVVKESEKKILTNGC